MKKLTIICAMFGLLLGCAGSSWAGFVFFDDFNSENSGQGVGSYSGFANWIVSSGSVDLIGYTGVGSPYWDLQPGNGLYVDVDGSTGAAGTMTTSASVDLLPGQYFLTFDVAGNQRVSSTDQMYYDVGGLLAGSSVVVGQDDPFQTVVVPFTVPSAMSASISFQGVGGDNYGALLDNVSISIVPAPGCILLVGIGAGVVGWLRRRGTL